MKEVHESCPEAVVLLGLENPIRGEVPTQEPAEWGVRGEARLGAWSWEVQSHCNRRGRCQKKFQTLIQSKTRDYKRSYFSHAWMPC